MLLVLGFIIVLGILSGIVPALLILKAQPIEIVRGTLRLKTKTIYSKVILIVQNVVSITMLVSAMGLFAMSSYYMQQETRSVAVKKVFGAEYNGVLKELVLSFMKMVAVAFVIGVPIAWLLMNRWLSDYGHRIDLHWWIFAIAGLTVAVIAAISVLYQSIKTARTNPAEALKKE